MLKIVMLFILYIALALSCLPYVFSAEAIVVRLSRVSTNNDEIQGLLDIRYHGKWGNICYWSYTFSNEAVVACRQLGYLGLGFTKYRASWQWEGIVTRISCSGRETNLDDCRMEDASPFNCSIRQDFMMIICRNNPALVGFLNATLLGRNAHMGILEVTSKSGEKAAVCYDESAEKNTATSKTVCAQMGYSDMQTPLATNKVSYKGTNFVSVDCSGTKQTLAACSMTFVRSCSSALILGVECKLSMATQQAFDIRLSPTGKSPNEGTVEVYRYGQWGVICDTGWNMTAAQVVCRQLGFRQAINAAKDAVFGQGTGIVFWNNVKCIGDEPSIAECKYAVAFERGVCHSVNAAGVVCSSERLPPISICSNSLHALTPGIHFIRSPNFPGSATYYVNGVTCYVNLTSPSNFTVYIHNKMFQNNHVEYLSFITSDVTDTFYGDDSSQKSMTYNTNKMAIKFQASIWTGKLKLNIQVTVPEAGLSTSTSPSTTTRQTAAVTSPLIAPHGEAPGSGAIGGLVGSVTIIVIAVIVGISLWKKGFIRFGRKNKESSGDFDAAAIQGDTAIEFHRNSDEYDQVGLHTANGPIYENSAFITDNYNLGQTGEATIESSENPCPPESELDYEDARDLNSRRRDVAEDDSASSPTEVASENDGLNSNIAEESPYAKLERVDKSDYLDFRELTAAQLRPV